VFREVPNTTTILTFYFAFAPEHRSPQHADYLALKITNSVPLCQNLDTNFPNKCLPLGLINSHRSPRVSLMKFLPFLAGFPSTDIFLAIWFPFGRGLDDSLQQHNV